MEVKELIVVDAMYLEAWVSIKAQIIFLINLHFNYGNAIVLEERSLL